jgi:hypothetical protein
MMDFVAVVAILFGLAAFLFVLAPRVSAGLVRVKAGDLPSGLGGRMEEEWLAELSAVRSRPGKLAFAIALMLARRRSFILGGESMTEIHDRPGNLVAILGGWKALLLVPALVFGAVAYAASYLLPVRYASEGLLLIRPADISKDFVRGLPDIPPDQRVGTLRQVLLSRASLLGMVSSIESLREDSKKTTTDKMIQDLRNSIEIRVSQSVGPAAAVSVRYVGYDPSTTNKVARWLVNRLLTEDGKNREDYIVSNLDFMEQQLAELGARLRHADLVASASALNQSEKRAQAREYALLESAYKSVFEKREDVKTLQALESKQKGAFFAVLDIPNEGRAVGPNRWGIAALGAGAGLALGGAAIFGLNRRQRRQLA